MTTPFNERTHSVQKCVLTYELPSPPYLSSYFGGLGCSCFGGCETNLKLYREQKIRYIKVINQRSDYCHPESTECCRCYAFGCMVAIRGGYRMARGWHYTKFSIECSSSIFFWYVLCVIVPFFLSFVFCFCFVFMFSLELCRCSSDIFLSSRPRTGLANTYDYHWGIVETRLVNVKTTTTGTTTVPKTCQRSDNIQHITY